MNVNQQRARQRKQDKRRRRRRDESRRAKYDPNDIRWIAAHEAGHAVAAVVYDIPLEFVDIRQRQLPDGRIGVGFSRTPVLSVEDIAGLGAEQLVRYMVHRLAGAAAEAQADRFYEVSEDDLDRRDVEQIAAVCVCGFVETAEGYEIPLDVLKANEGKIVEMCNSALLGALSFVVENKATIDAVAAALIQKTSLTGDEVAALVAAATTST